MNCHNCNERVDPLDIPQQRDNKYLYCSDECNHAHTTALQVRKNGKYRVNNRNKRTPRRRVFIKLGVSNG